MDNFIRRLLIQLMSTPKPLDPTASRIPNVPISTTPFGASNPAPPVARPPAMSAALPGTAISPSSLKNASVSGAGLPVGGGGKTLTPSVSTSEEFRLAPQPPRPSMPTKAPPAPFTPSLPGSPLVGGSDMFNIPSGDLQGGAPEEIPEEPPILPSNGMQMGITLPSSNPSGAVGLARASQGSPDLVSIIRKALSRIPH